MKISQLPDKHQAALKWFSERAGLVQPWPRSLDDGTLLATRAKGIYKPKWSEYALSIRETIDGPYSDKDPTTTPEGKWVYKYFQEGRSPLERDYFFTNRGLVKCLQDQVPIGVMRQVQLKPTVMYRILGLGLISSWDEGYFYINEFRLVSDR